MTAYTITNNAAFGSKEITFDGIPSKEIREALKALKFKWHGIKKIWYGFAEESEIEKICGGASEAPKVETKKENKISFDKEMIKNEYSKAWKSEHMIDYCMKELANVAILPDGGIISIDKQSIEKRFCFGESGYDIDDAIKAAEHARTSEKYFKDENMKSFNEYVKDLEEALEEEPKYYLIIKDTHYIGQTSDCRLRGLEWIKTWEALDALGGSAYLSELPGKYLEKFHGRIATPEEIKIILEAYKQARDAHEKRVDTYLKKYGLKNVHSWTYWREA